MADSDPISDSSPAAKKRKVTHGFTNGKQWDSGSDSGDGLDEADYDTVPTQLISNNQTGRTGNGSVNQTLEGRSLQQPTNVRTSSQPFVTEPTQTWRYGTQQQSERYKTQPTQRVEGGSSQVMVERSSPPATDDLSPKITEPAPLQRAPFAKPRSMLASAIAPPGTAFRRPFDARPRPAPTPPQQEEESDEEDPPVRIDLGEQNTQGLRSNLKPTKFTSAGGRRLESVPEQTRVVKESPRSSTNTFSSLMSQFEYNGPPTKTSRPADDMASAYGGASRRPRPPQTPAQQTTPARAQPVVDTYSSVDQITDYMLRKKVQEIHAILSNFSIQSIVNALEIKKGNKDDAMDWLVVEEEKEESARRHRTAGAPEERDELSLSAMKGVARPAARMDPRLSQPIFSKPTAKQEVKAPQRTIIEKYASQARRSSQQEAVTEIEDEDRVQKPAGRRLIKGRRPARSSSPPSPAPSVQRVQRKKNVVTISDDEDEAPDSDTESGITVVEVPRVSTFEDRLLNFFNECSVKDLVDLSAQPEDTIKFLLGNRPFEDLDAIRAVAQSTETKSGKRSKARPIGDKIVDDCSEMWTGYDAVDELVAECERIAKPIQNALKGWGVGNGSDGELQLMNLDEAHDSGIGTPSSPVTGDEETAVAKPSKAKPKGRFLRQPVSMAKDVELKDYQLVGLNWLNLLWSKKLSCILADDMGLGKTCQVIAFLAHLQETKLDGIALVIVPGSTLENWLREFQKFAPELNVVPYYGGQNERPQLQVDIDKSFSTIDVVVTTYDMSVKKFDNVFLRKLEPAVCVYDEAHMLRNPKSNRYRELMRIPADFKIMLTGTPLQNNLQELVAVLAFIMPQLFTEKGEDLDYIFKHKATTKDADNGALLSAERIARARTMMTPFILRRKKQQVLWLPTKHSRVESCTMTPSQQSFYFDTLEEAQMLLQGKTDTNKAGVAKQTSNMMMALRKAAIHPLLSRRLYTDSKLRKIQTALMKHDEFKDNPPERIWAYLTGEAAISLKGGDYGLHRFCADRAEYLGKYMLKNEWMDSGKVQRFTDLIKPYAANGDRVLVFSQFTTLMDILEAVLETLDIKFMRLDGSTKMDVRQDMIDQFSHDESITVFMLSTKAGGAGINLACANKVIIFDSGFNPQDDIQAENRAHRVGQTRDVEVVRLVTKGTIEEQIHALGESKLALDERVAGDGGEAESKSAEKEGEKMVEKMLLQSLEKGGNGQQDSTPIDTPASSGDAPKDIKDDFKKGLEGAGLTVG